MNRTQLTISFQKACAEKLLMWQKHRKDALYRRTEDFVQWLAFDVSNFEVQIIPSYSIQALATQFPGWNLVLGDRIRDKRGVDLWIKPDDWDIQKNEIVEQILQQIDPPPLEPLTTEIILKFLHRSPSNHESAMTALGIATILAGNVKDGYQYLEQALDKYRSIPYPWARAEEARLKSWLSCAPEDIVHVLRQQAEIGAQLLRLK